MKTMQQYQEENDAEILKLYRKYAAKGEPIDVPKEAGATPEEVALHGIRETLKDFLLACNKVAALTGVEPFDEFTNIANDMADLAKANASRVLENAKSLSRRKE